MKITIEIPDSLIDAIGSNCASQYWAEMTTNIVNSETVVYVREHNEGSAEPGPWVALTDLRRRLGLELMAAKAPRQFGQALAGNADASTGDIWLQLAILREIKYG